MTDEIPLVYRIDPLDDIVFVNDEWIRFADANDGANLSPEKILNCGLWDFITDETTRQLYRQIVDRVRSGYATRFSLRCDAPACRRVIEMSVSKGPENTIEFQTRCLEEAPREPQPLLSATARRAGDLLRICSWCNRVNVDGDWVEIEEAAQQLGLFESSDLPQLTHGMCQACYEKMEASLN